jgi:hypothetical protein
MNKEKAETLWKSGKRHWWFWMGVALTLFSVVPAITSHIIPRWVYWLAAFVCFVNTAYKMWSEQYDRAEMHRREAAEMYADIVLDWLKLNHPMIFTVPHVAEKMQYDEGKIVQGLEILEKEFKVVQNNGPRGWIYHPMLAIPLICQVRRLIPVKTIDAGTF